MPDQNRHSCKTCVFEKVCKYRNLKENIEEYIHKHYDEKFSSDFGSEHFFIHIECEFRENKKPNILYREV